MTTLTDRVAVITGGANGIGAATCRRMAALGARVVVADLDGEGAAAVAADLSAAGADAIGVRADVTVEDEVAAMIAAAVDAWGRIDILHNNAGTTAVEIVSRDAALHEMQTDLWDLMMAVNLRGPMFGIKHALPVFLAQGRGVIVNTSSAPGLEIAKVLVENNVSAQTGKTVSDHLEVSLKNTTTKPLSGLELYYTISDPQTGASEGYFTRLTGLVVDPGATRTVNFDDTAGADHYPVNKYSLYYTDKNALVVDVTASAPGLKVATFTVKKDAGGAEAGVE